MEEGLCDLDKGLDPPADERLVNAELVKRNTARQTASSSRSSGLHLTPIEFEPPRREHGLWFCEVRIDFAKSVDYFARHKFFVVVPNGAYNPDKCSRIRAAFSSTNWKYHCGRSDPCYATVRAGQLLTESLADGDEVHGLPGALKSARDMDCALHDARNDIPYSDSDDVVLEFPSLLCLCLGGLHSASATFPIWQRDTMSCACDGYHLDALEDARACIWAHVLCTLPVTGAPETLASGLDM